MYPETIILELIDMTYKAAGDPDGWPKLLQRLGQVLGGTACTVHHHEIPSQESNFSADWNVDPVAISEYTNYYGFRNIWRFFRPELFATGSVNTSQMMCPEEVFLRSEYYNDFLRQYGFYHCLVATLRDDSSAMSNLTIFRPKSDESFGDRESELLRLLAPHLVRAFQLHGRIRGLENKARVLEETLDRMQTAIVLVNARGNVLFVNKSAFALFQRQKYVCLTPTGIQVTNVLEQKQLARLIQGAARTGSGSAHHPGGTMSISRDSFHRPLHVLVSPLRTGALHLEKGIPAAVVFITDPERKPWLPAEWLRQLHGLTPAESRLAQLLASGSSVKEASEQLKVTPSTLRWRIKSIFGKTGTNRQSELVRLLLLSPAEVFFEAHRLHNPG